VAGTAARFAAAMALSAIVAMTVHRWH